MTILSQLRAAVERATADVLSKNFGTLATVLRQAMEDDNYLDSVVFAVEGLLNHAAALIAVAETVAAWTAQDGDTDENRQRMSKAVKALTREG